MMLRFDHSFRFSQPNLRDVSIRIPIAAEHYAINLKCDSNQPMKTFNVKGNILGQLRFSSLSSKVVRWIVDISIRTFEKIESGSNWGKKSEYESSDVQKYCEAKKYWEINTETIQKAAIRITAESGDDIHQMIRKTFSFVRQSIKLPEPQDRRYGALRALSYGFGDCDEFTDLFVTLLRALRIPTRRITGVFAIGEKIENHTWAEVLLPYPSQHWATFDVALKYFAHRSCFHFGRKIESTSSTRDDVAVRWKGRKNASVNIDIAPPLVLSA